MTGTGVIRPPAVSSSYSSRRRTSSAPSGSISCRSSSAWALGSSARRSAASSGSISSRTSAARLTSKAERISTWSPSGISCRTSASRSSWSSLATSKRRLSLISWRASAKSAGLRSSWVATNWVAACGSVLAPCRASAQSMIRVSLRRSRLSGEREWPRRTKSLLTNQSPERCRSMAMSSMVASPLPSARVTRRSNSSATTRVSAPRCSNRRRLTSPVQMTCVWSMEVIRVIGTNTRFLPGTSTTMPTTCGAPLVPRESTTTSRSRPRRSPNGSKTSSPRRRATNTRERFVLTHTGYRVCSLLAEFPAAHQPDG